MSKRELKKENRELKNRGVFTKLVKLIKLVLFVSMLVFIFLVSPKISNYIINLGVEQLTRIINMILVTVLVVIYFYKK